MFALLALFGAAQADADCLPKHLLEFQKVAVQAQAQYAQYALKVGDEILGDLGLDTKIVDKIAANVQTLEDKWVAGINELEQNACATCTKLVNAYEAVKDDIEKFMDAFATPALAATDEPTKWQNNPLFKAIDGILDMVDAFAKAACPAPASKFFLAADDCKAKEDVSMAVESLQSTFKFALEHLKELEDLPFVGNAAKTATKVLTDGQAVLDAEGPKLEEQACANCQNVKALFDDVKEKVKTGIDGIGNEAVSSAVDGVLDTIDSGFDMLCPAELFAPLKEECQASEDVKNAVDTLQLALKFAVDHLTEAEGMPIIGDAAKTAVKVITDGQAVLDAEAPKLEEKACAACKDLGELFEDVKGPIEKGIDAIGNDAISTAVDGVLNTIDSGFQTLCPAELFAPLDGCAGQAEVDKIFDTVEQGMKVAQTVVTYLEKIPFLQPVATKALDWIEDAATILDAEETKINADFCPTCRKFKALADQLGGNAQAFLDKLEDSWFKDELEKVLQAAKKDLAALC